MNAADADKSPAINKKPATTEQDDYKAKMAENRRLAREKAERESAEEQARIEEQKYDAVFWPLCLLMQLLFCAEGQR